MKKRPLIIAHRGSSYNAPENTMSAIKLAWQEETDALEVDVHRTKDAEIVVIHDEDTLRTCGKKLILRNSTLQEIQLLECGSWKAEKFRGEKIPTFKNIVKTVPHNKKLIIEIKGGSGCLEPVKNILANSSLKAEQIVIMDFELDNMIKAKLLFPEIEILWLYEFIPALTRHNAETVFKKIIENAVTAGMHGINIELNPFITKNLIDEVHNQDMKFYVWTVNKTKEALYLRDIGADGLTTDRPGWMRQLYG